MNPISLIGAAIATAMAVLFIGLFGVDVWGKLQNPYLGLLLYVAVPAALLLGLLLILLGAWIERRRLRRGGAVHDWPVFDFRSARTRATLLMVFAMTCVNVLIFSIAAYGGVHHMETAEFCGATCHQTMEPEYSAYQVSPHASVACVQCHVGSGAESLVQSKINGTRQLWHLVTNNIPKPVAAPVRRMRPARETCETCHWPEKFHGDKLRQIKEYSDDEKSSETVTRVELHVGGGRATTGAGSGIHWHMNIDNKVEFIATDAARQTIPWVRFTGRDGKVKEFVADGVTKEQIAAAEHRTMDCMDCHNRPAHTFEPNAERAVDNAIARGLIPRDLPFARRETVKAVKAEFESREAALSGIDAELRNAFGAAADPAVLERTIAGAKEIYTRNVFPAMKVKWTTYPNNLGHVAFPGCFRCHDDNHKASDGTTIGQECQTCHELP